MNSSCRTNFGQQKIVTKDFLCAITSREPDFYPGVDQKIGYVVRNMLEVPLRGTNQIIGVLRARNKKEGLLSLLLGECTDELQALVADETGEESAAGRIRKRIEEIFGGKEDVISKIDPAGYLRGRIEELKAQFTHREMEIATELEEGAPFIRIPSDVFQKVT